MKMSILKHRGRTFIQFQSHIYEYEISKGNTTNEKSVPIIEDDCMYLGSYLGHSKGRSSENKQQAENEHVR